MPSFNIFGCYYWGKLTCNLQDMVSKRLSDEVWDDEEFPMRQADEAELNAVSIN